MARIYIGRAQRIRSLLSVNRGLTVREIHDAIGETTPLARGLVATELSAFAKIGKARHNNQPARGGRLWYATETTMTDFRKSAEPKPQKVPKPRHKQTEPVITPKQIRMPVQHGKPQTVAEWQAAGGKIEILPNGACSKPFERIDVRNEHFFPSRRGVVNVKHGGAL